MSISPPPPPPPESTTTTTSTLSRLIRTTLSYDTNVMLAAIISLLLVILFVLLLHLYTRWFLQQARRRSRSSVAVPRVLGSRLHQRFTVIDTTTSDHSNPKLGLPFSTIASLPLFVYKSRSDEHHDHELDCAICLSVFEDEEIGRRLPACGHAFHVECIDMWLHSHSTCPICRSPIQCHHSRKIEQLEVEITDPERNSIGFVDNDEQLRLEIVESDQSADVAVVINDADIGGSSLSSIRESPKKLIATSSSCSSRSGGKVHPSSIVNGDESEV